MYRADFDKKIRQFIKGLGTSDKNGEAVREYARKLLAEQLVKCEDYQIALFNKMYISIDEIPFDKMRWAYRQIMTTIKENQRKGE